MMGKLNKPVSRMCYDDHYYIGSKLRTQQENEYTDRQIHKTGEHAF